MGRSWGGHEESIGRSHTCDGVKSSFGRLVRVSRAPEHLVELPKGDRARVVDVEGLKELVDLSFVRPQPELRDGASELVLGHVAVLIDVPSLEEVHHSGRLSEEPGMRMRGGENG